MTLIARFLLLSSSSSIFFFLLSVCPNAASDLEIGKSS